MFPEVKTDKEHWTNLRNMVAFRMVEREANISYWELVTKKAKHNSQEKVDAMNSRSKNEQLLKKDKVFLKVIDSEMERLDG